MSRRTLLESSEEGGQIDVKPLEYGEFLYEGKRTLSAKKQYLPKIEEFPDVLERDDHYISLAELTSKLETDAKQGLREDRVPFIRERYGENVFSYSEKLRRDFYVYRPRGTYYFLCIGIIFCLIIVGMKFSAKPPKSLPPDNDLVYLIMILTLIVSISISVWQEIKCYRIMKSFKDSYMTYASVFRDGKKKRIQKREVVVGDLVLLKAGNYIPADIRITKAWNMKVDESALTHNFDPKEKTPRCSNRNPAFSQNVVFAGTSCVDGYGQGIAFATGDDTAYGKMLKKTVVLQKTDTSAHKRIRKVLICLGAITLTTGIILFGLTLLAHYPWLTLMTVILAQVIVSMPEILYSATTISLYTTAKKIASINCLPKHLEAVAKLSSVTVICCDKTATITQNRMTVVRLWIDDQFVNAVMLQDRSGYFLVPSPDKNTWFAFSRAAALCSTIANKSRRNRCIIRKGCSCDQSEVAIMEFINSISSNGSPHDKVVEFKEMYETIFDIPHNSYTKYHVTIHDTSKSPHHEEGHYLLCMKGAVDEILKFCSTALINGKNEPITALQDLQFQQKFERAMINGNRIIGFCDYYMPNEKYTPGYIFQESDIPLTGMRFLGFVSMLDPPRASVPEAIKRCREDGIKVVLTSGDHPITAKAIAMKVGIISSGAKMEDDVMQNNYDLSEDVFTDDPTTENDAPQELNEGNSKAAVVTGSDLESIETEDLQKLVKEYDEFVFARITPQQKIKILESFKKNGEVVALTGGSRQDAEAMHKADISIGMGLHGCDASRDTADVILTGDSFNSIVLAIEEGRTIYDNLQKAMVYVFSSNVPAILPFFIMGLLHLPIPMGAGFIFLITLIAEIFPVLILAKEGPKKYIFSKERTGHRNFFCHRIFEKAYFQVGIVGVLSSMFIYFVILAENGFMPSRIIDIDSTQWNSPAINDLVDSFDQEWTYSSRKHLEYTCQTAFFLSLIILQFFNLGIIRTRVYKACYFSWQFLASSAFIMGYQMAIILILMYSFPEFHVYLHPYLYPLNVTDWLWCLPFPFLLLVLEEIRRFIIRHSQKDSWLQREIF